MQAVKVICMLSLCLMLITLIIYVFGTGTGFSEDKGN
jgi:tetrahydromethanopterin S-methyltransferase subunit D